MCNLYPNILNDTMYDRLTLLHKIDAQVNKVYPLDSVWKKLYNYVVPVMNNQYVVYNGITIVNN